MKRHRADAQLQFEQYSQHDPSALSAFIIPELTALSDLDDSRVVLQRLRSIDWAFTEDDTTYLAHDIHPYPAKFIPQIPANLIAALSLRGETVWDPFGGSGTTALEALLLGRNAVSSDANPLASLITKAKCTALTPEQRSTLRSLERRLQRLTNPKALDEHLARVWNSLSRDVPSIPNIEHWFSGTVIREVACLIDETSALRDPVVQRFSRVVLSSLLVTVSNQDAETRYACRAKVFESGKVTRLFCRALNAALAKHEPLQQLLGYRQALVVTADVRQLASERTSPPPPSSVDLVVTSPPYANATDYHLYHRFRLFWLGFDPRALAQQEIGSHLRHQREGTGYQLYEAEMMQALRGIATRLRPGRYAVLVLADAVFEGQTFHTAQRLAKAAEGLGYEVVGVISRPIHATRRSFIPPARRAKTDDLLILRLPPQKLKVCFHEPAYKMWPYERTLRHSELKAILSRRLLKRGRRLEARISCYEIDQFRNLAFSRSIGTEEGSNWPTWQTILENGDLQKGRKDPKYLTHGIHPYKGKFYPQLGRALLNLAQLSSSAHILDPFCGSGTLLLEAQLSGYQATGFDLNPLAVLISKAKTAVALESPVTIDTELREFSDRISEDGSNPECLQYFRNEIRSEVEHWFPEPVAARLGWLMSNIERVHHGTSRLVLRVLLSSIIRQISHQEPSDLRIRRRKVPLRDAPVLELLRARVVFFRERLQHFGARMSHAPRVFRPIRVVEADSRNSEAFRGADGQYECVVTSPPYATALPYIDTDRLSLLVIMGMEATRRAEIEMRLTGSREIARAEREELESQITDGLQEELGSATAVSLVTRILSLNSKADVGFRRKNMASLLVRYYRDMFLVFRNLSRAVQPGGRLFFIIGQNRTVAGDAELVIPSDQILSEMGKSLRWRQTHSLPITVTKEGLLHSHNSITKNTVLGFRTPSS